MIQIFSAHGTDGTGRTGRDGPTEGSTRGPRGPKKINGDVDQPTDQKGEYRAICRMLENRKKVEICNFFLVTCVRTMKNVSLMDSYAP